MRKFIFSDIHGLGNVYYSIMNYLDNISQFEDIVLYINGDLIDRGIDSAEILLDVKRRIEENNGRFKIVYLGGNHELMMYQVYTKRKNGIYVSEYNDWYNNGGSVTGDLLSEMLDYNKDKILEVVDFISNLRIYHKFDEKINGKNIILVHAAHPFDIKDKCDSKIKDDDDIVFYSVWTRKYDPYIPFRCRIGCNNYFTIVGHTPNDNPLGFEYHPDENYLNIDGGCVRYAKGLFQYDHIPLIEIKDDFLKILTFNNNNEITNGNYFVNGNTIPFTKEELDIERECLNKKLKVKKLIKDENGEVYYEHK